MAVIAAIIVANDNWAMNVYKNFRSSFVANSYFVPKYIFQIDDIFIMQIASGLLTSADANDEVSSEITSGAISGTGAAAPDPKNNKNKKNKNGDSSKSNEKQEHNAKGEEKTNSQQRNKWIKHDVYNKVRNRFGKKGVDKFIRAMKKGNVGPENEQGIKYIPNGVEVGGTKYYYEIKVLHKFGDWRIFGNLDSVGNIIFEIFAKGIH